MSDLSSQGHSWEQHELDHHLSLVTKWIYISRKWGKNLQIFKVEAGSAEERMSVLPMLLKRDGGFYFRLSLI